MSNVSTVNKLLEQIQALSVAIEEQKRRHQWSSLLSLGFGMPSPLPSLRTQSLPLLLSLEGARGSLLLDPNTQDLVTRHRDGLESLNLGLSVTRRDNLYPERRILVRGPFPALRTLRVHANEGISFSKVDEWLDLLIAAPALTTCTFDHMSFNGMTRCTPAHRLVHPALRYLCFGEAYTFSSRLTHGNTATLLKYVTLSALQTLRITHLDIKESEPISFLARSSPPLRSLSLVFNQRWPPQFMSAIFKSMPTLTRLELVRASWSDPNCMLTLLTAAQDGALPLLHTLRVVMHAVRPYKIDYLRLSSILRTRRINKHRLRFFNSAFLRKTLKSLRSH
ncbi:hypothetical protein R3P38DRAFT_3213598 [Favolaschia claudopus]|uniref:Uncharacterized protein n=1 Tax=Favolaschia claudopus TaxID=2862362 RepID=A0AAW0ACE9_9AGAR